MLPRSVRAVTAAALLGAASGWGHAADQALDAGVKIPPHQRFTLANGVKLILIPRHEVPLIAFEAVLRGGARLDPERRAGVASLAAELLTHGAGARDAYGFADAVEGAGGSFDADAHSEAIVVHGQFLAHDRELLLGLLADALQRPRFDAGRARQAARAAHRVHQGGQGLRAAKPDRHLRPCAAVRRTRLWQTGRRQREQPGEHYARGCAQVLPRSIRRRSADTGVCRRLRSGRAAQSGHGGVCLLVQGRRARAAIGRARAGQGPAGTADRLPRIGTDLFLDCQCRRGARLSAACGARRHQYRVRRQLRLDADAGAAHQVGAELFGACRISSRHGAR